MNRFFICIFLLSFFLFPCPLSPVTCPLTYAAVPHLLNYQGRLTDAAGAPLNGTYAVTFRLYDVETGGTPLWEETYSTLSIAKGVFSVLLGSVTNLNLTFDKQYYLEIKVGSEVMTPRQKIASAAYAIRAEYGVPSGVIVMWSGKIADIPDGWALCDGTNGTPDLRDRFVVGAIQDDGGIAKTGVTGSLTKYGEGSVPEHTHALGSLIIQSAGDHTHHEQIYNYQLHSVTPAYLPSVGGNHSNFATGETTCSNEPIHTRAAGSHTHSLLGSLASYGAGSKNIAIYWALAFIMKK